MVRNAIIIGFGVSGRSAAELLLQHSWNVVAVDAHAAELSEQHDVQSLIARGVPLISDREVFELDNFKLAILSPGIDPRHPLLMALRSKGVECIGEAELAFRSLNVSLPVVGITGTNGKTSVTLLVEHVLKFLGHEARALGNVGVPLASEVHLLPDNALIVAELSSFQLETMQKKALSEALILNITPDHLDRYGSMEEYAAAKARIGYLLKPNGKLFVFSPTAARFPSLFEGMPLELYGYEKGLDFSTDLISLFKGQKKVGDLPKALRGNKGHDLENFMAAFLVCERHGASLEDFIKGWDTFIKPRHRLEFVKEVRGVAFFDDSKGTNVDAVVRAVETMTRPTHLIAGGVHKGSSYTPWLPHFEGKVKKIYAIGEAACQIDDELSFAIPVERCISLEEAVKRSFESALQGEAVLLSPGCSSFDMFKDYAHRGEKFVELVNRL